MQQATDKCSTLKDVGGSHLLVDDVFTCEEDVPDVVAHECMKKYFCG